MILFLDIDGVLHPFPRRLLDRPFSAIGHLWSILQRLPDASVVITSTWRETHEFSALVALLLAHDGEEFRDRFIGVTPVLENDYTYVPGIRQQEVEAWLAANAPQSMEYLILDDIDSYFQPGCERLHLVDGRTGLTAADVESVVTKLLSRRSAA